MDYSAQVRERFAAPRNIGVLASGPDVISSVAGSVEQGAQFWLYARIDADRIEELKYRVYGCPHTIAAVSVAAEELRGATLAQLEGWSWRHTASVLEVPAHKRGRLLLLEDAIRGLGRVWRARP
jgi:NifU-like protein involved in Fe-S cluster formation